jgi:hypothetical protein
MNHFYHYTYQNGVQFTTTMNPIALGVSIDLGLIIYQERPKLLGIWRLKKINGKTT